MSKQKFSVWNETKLKMVKLTSNGDAKFAYKAQETFGADIFEVLSSQKDICKFISGAVKWHFLDDPMITITKIEKMYSDSDVQNDDFARIVSWIKKYTRAQKREWVNNAELVKKIEDHLFDILIVGE